MFLPEPNEGFVWAQAPWGAVLRCVPLSAVAEHAFTVRDLPLGERSERGHAAWKALAQFLGVAADAVARVRQMHGAGVFVIRRGEARTKDPADADIVVSDDPSVAISVRVADCVPLLLADRRTGSVAAAHAGWRGTAASVATAAVRALQENFGVRPQDVTAAAGPSIGPCCYQVGEEVLSTFRAAGYDEASIDRWFKRNGAIVLDLWRVQRDQLERAGVLPARIFTADLCTATYRDVFCSYRAAGPDTGRMVGIVRASAR